jgi:hypothetical protein
MAKFHQGVSGLMICLIDSVLNTIWRRIDTMRIIPASVTNPGTPAQVAQRTRFALVPQFLRPLLRFVKIGFKGYAVRQSAFNAAMSHHMHHAGVEDEFRDQALDFSLVRVPQGTPPRFLFSTNEHARSPGVAQRSRGACGLWRRAEGGGRIGGFLGDFLANSQRQTAKSRFGLVTW